MEYSVDLEAEQVKFIQRGITAVVFAEKTLDDEEQANMLVKHITEFKGHRDNVWITNELLQWADQL